jgi:hypothetical protein
MGAHPRIGNVLDVPKADRVYAANPNSMNIVRVWEQATEAEIADGVNWYRDAHALALKLDPANPNAAAGVIAALSPMMSWGQNVNLAVRAYADGAASGALSGSVAKANRILNGETPEDVLGGNKVRAFYGCIADPSSDAVCIDRHAFDIAVGRVTNNASRHALGRKGTYERFAAAYVRAADILSKRLGTPVSASEVQAVTWTVWRRLKGLAD